MNGRRTRERRSEGVGHTDVLTGVFAGLPGGVIFGAILHLVGDIAVVGHLVGSRTAFAGWLALLVISVIGAVVYYLVVGLVAPLGFLAADPQTGAALGLAFGICCWFGAIIAVPLWIRLFGLALSVPAVHWPSFVGLLIYGMIVGGLAPLLTTSVR